jgi:endonuclease/exonuclease/phosphatase family metal-dependent hydrolase
MLTSAFQPPRAPQSTLEPSCQTVIQTSVDSSVFDVQWLRASSGGDRRALDQWCAGVGPAVRHATRAADGDRMSSLVVITWNTNVGGGDIRGLVRDLRAGALTGGVPVTQFVLLVQEAFRAGSEVPRNAQALMPRRIDSKPPSSAREDIVATARDLGLELFYVPSMSNRWDTVARGAEDRGNAILSTLPLRELCAVELPYEGQRRVAAVATVRGLDDVGQPWSLRLVNVHLDNRARWSRVYRSLGASRTRQARALVEQLGLSDMSVPTVLGGDLNTWASAGLEGAEEVLRTHFPLPSAEQTKRTLAVSHGVGAMRLDHLMFRLEEGATARAERLDDARGSDHYPLLGRIEFASTIANGAHRVR